jgi:hypothetical protein
MGCLQVLELHQGKAIRRACMDMYMTGSRVYRSGIPHSASLSVSVLYSSEKWSCRVASGDRFPVQSSPVVHVWADTLHLIGLGLHVLVPSSLLCFEAISVSAFLCLDHHHLSPQAFPTPCCVWCKYPPCILATPSICSPGFYRLPLDLTAHTRPRFVCLFVGGAGSTASRLPL